MEQGLIQQQRQEQRQQQGISVQQLLLAQLVELPIQQMAERIETELHDNPALEKKSNDDDFSNADESQAPIETDEMEDFEKQREREERNDALDAALEGLGRDDEDLPVYQGGYTSDDEQEPSAVYGEGRSFHDLLMEQVGELELNDDDRYVMEYIIQSLDDDGLLRTPLADICEQLAIYHNTDITEQHAQQLLHLLQQMDPAGIGARSLRECLLLQIDRKKPSEQRDLMRLVVNNHFDEFTKKHWNRIQTALALSDSQMQLLMNELRRLNPKPGAAMGEAVGRSMQQITPDFIVDTHDDGSISIQLNNGDIPQLEISPSFAQLLKDFQNNKVHLTRQQKEALLYTKQKVDAAQGFIEAVRARHQTLLGTMKAIVQLQRPFFTEGDEELLRPMILRDVADITGKDLSTISRVSNSKYVQTRWGTFPLKFFFSDGYVTENGEELSTRKIKVALRSMIDSENKKKPLTDDELSALLKQQGFPIARRTVAKYREQLGFPVARLRKG